MKKIDKLKKALQRLKSVVIAYSGGLDSTFLLKMAIDTLGRDRVLAVTARSETYPYSEYREAKRIAKAIGAQHRTIHTEELAIENFKENPVERCYYCKKELFADLVDIKRRYGLEHVADGTNYDDLSDVRYGRKAAAELGVQSPLLEVRITKEDIRKFSKDLKLPTWDKPSFACLASRIPFHSHITKEALKKIDKAEAYLRRLGFRQVRVRLHNDIARLEVIKKDFARAVKLHSTISRKLKKLGFTYITLDLVGYRTGSMHEAVSRMD